MKKMEMKKPRNRKGASAGKQVICKRAVIFDMDDVITDTMQFHVRAVQAALALAKVRVSACDVLMREGQPAPELLQDLLKKNKKKAPRELIERMIETKDSTFKKIVKRKFIKGSRAFLSLLKKEGLDLALVTGASKSDLSRSLPREVQKKFKIIVTSDDIENGKPHGEPYRAALKKLGVEPAEALVVENAPYGVEAAARAGIECAALTTTVEKRHLKKANYIFSSYEELNRKLRFSRSGPS